MTEADPGPEMNVKRLTSKLDKLYRRGPDPGNEIGNHSQIADYAGVSLEPVTGKPMRNKGQRRTGERSV